MREDARRTTSLADALEWLANIINRATSRRCRFFHSVTPFCCGCKHMNSDVEYHCEIIYQILPAIASMENIEDY